MLVIRTFSTRPVWSSPSVLCLGRTCSTGSATRRGKRQKHTNNNLVYLWIRGDNASDPRGFESSTAEDWLKKTVLDSHKNKESAPIKSGLDWKQKELEILPKHQWISSCSVSPFLWWKVGWQHTRIHSPPHPGTEGCWPPDLGGLWPCGGWWCAAKTTKPQELVLLWTQTYDVTWFSVAM